MKRKILFVLFLVFGVSLCEGQSWLWGLGGLGSVLQNSGDTWPMAVDSLGDVYFIGSGGGPVIKFDKNGKFLWQKDTINSLVKSACIDKFGNVFILGVYGNSLMCGSFILHSKGSQDCFLIKMDPTGKILWAKSSQSNSLYSSAQGFSVCSDNVGDSYLTGLIEDTVSFGTHIVTCSGQWGVFVAKYDSSGNALWAESSICDGLNDASGISISSDGEKNIYVTGNLQDSATFGTYQVKGSMFLVDYDSNGSVLWAKGINAVSQSVSSDNDGNAYVTGGFVGQTVFGIDTINSFSLNNNFFLVKYNKLGDCMWVRNTTQANSYLQGIYVACDRKGNEYAAMGFDALTVADYKTNWNTYTLSSYGTDPLFIVKYDSLGNLLCYDSLISGGDDYVTLDIDNRGLVYLCGDISDTSVIIALDTLTVSFVGLETGFIAKWKPCGVSDGVSKLEAKIPQLIVFPNPNPGKFTIAFVWTKNFVSGTIEIYNMMGEKVTVATLKQVQGDNLIDLTNEPNGLYLYRVISEDGSLVGEGKVVIQK